MQTLICVGLGSFCGGIMRYGCGLWVQQHWGESGFPRHTLLINLGGCLLLGVLNGLFSLRELMHPDLRAALTVGLCGGFTTFSTFSQESFRLMRSGAWFSALSYVALSVILGLILFGAGWWAARRVI